MLDQEIVKIAQDRIRIEISEHNRNLRTEIDRIKSEMAGKGVLRSGMTIKRISDLCANAVRNRAQIVWQTLFRFITTSGISYSDGLSDELKALVAQHLPEKLGDLNGFVKQASEIAGSPNMHERYAEELSAARRGGIAKVGTEIDLFVHSLKRKKEIKTEEKNPTVFNIYSPVGSIQTGDNSIANVSQNIDTEVKEQISKALEDLVAAINDSSVELTNPKEELIEVIQESQVELAKTKPNVTRLRSLLTTIGGSIQVIESLKPAYDLLKQTMVCLGISLP
ncbi:hypothetical protein KQH27_00485 [bacterium]|nr:hypothetical protein [bacterium]